jgi:hypothetical protein
MRILFVVSLAPLISLFGCGSDPQTGGFLARCDKIAAELSKPSAPFVQGNSDTKTHHAPFFEDAYGVSALCEAFRLTGDPKYLNTARRWADEMVAFQKQMIPAGAYYLNYSIARQPGQTVGNWYVADSSTIAQAILRVARIVDGPTRTRYLASVEFFFGLVETNYTNADGGVSDGIWGNYKASWWGSTAIFGALAFSLYSETGEQRYYDRGIEAFDWLTAVGQTNFVYPSFSDGAPEIVLYSGEFYVRAWPYVMKTQREDAARQELQFDFDWMKANQKSQNPESSVDYSVSTHMAGLPYLSYTMRRQFPTTDAELKYLETFVARYTDFSDVHTWALNTWLAWSESARLISYIGGGSV